MTEREITKLRNPFEYDPERSKSQRKADKYRHQGFEAARQMMLESLRQTPRKKSRADSTEGIKCAAFDAGWQVLDDRPDDYFMRIGNGEFTADIYYSRKLTIRLKHRHGENDYLYGMTDDKVEEMLADPFKFYSKSYATR